MYQYKLFQYLAVLGLFASCLSSARADGTVYKFTTLNMPAAPFYQVASINDKGQVVGNSFLYSNGAYTRLDDPGQAFIYHATAINNRGQMVGFFYDYDTTGTFIGHGYVNTRGNYVRLDNPNVKETFSYGSNAGTYPTDINDNGQVVGWYLDDTSGGDFVYSNGVYKTLNDPVGSFARGINISGQVAGYFYDASGVHGFVNTNGIVRILNHPDSPNGTYAYGINDSGQVAGYFIDAAGSCHGFVYSHGTYTTLGDPHVAPNTYGCTWAFDINNHGQVVGVYRVASGYNYVYVATPSTGGRNPTPLAGSDVGHTRRHQ